MPRPIFVGYNSEAAGERIAETALLHELAGHNHICSCALPFPSGLCSIGLLSGKQQQQAALWQYTPGQLCYCDCDGRLLPLSPVSQRRWGGALPKYNIDSGWHIISFEWA